MTIAPTDDGRWDDGKQCAKFAYCPPLGDKRYSLLVPQKERIQLNPSLVPTAGLYSHPTLPVNDGKRTGNTPCADQPGIH